jgi:integrase
VLFRSPTIRDFIKVSLFTGARRSNVLGMKWENLDLKRGVWKVPGEVTKNGSPLVITLHPQVITILDQRPDFSPYVFPAERITAEQVATVRELHDQKKSTREIAATVSLSQTTVCRILEGVTVGSRELHKLSQ